MERNAQQQRNPAVWLALNGEPIYLLNPIITVSITREEKDMSGQKSSTKKSEKGVKAKEMTVSGLIPYRRKEWLEKLFSLCEASDKKGAQTKYRVSSRSAEAANMREVQFSDKLTAYEQDQRQAWRVDFKLREVNSVSEKREKRKAKPKKKTHSETAPAAKPTAGNTPAQAPVDKKPEEESWITKVSRTVDDAIGPAG